MTRQTTSEMQRIILVSRPEKAPVPDNFRLESAPVPRPGAGELLVRVIWLSLDPYMRGRMDAGKSYAAPVELGAVMEGGAVGEVIESNHPDFPAGSFVNGPFGWQSHAISDGAMVRRLDPAIAPISTAVGVLGMPGMTAWAGLNLHGRPKEGETLVVAAASGAVGAMVGQLGKAAGLRVVGIAGGAEKCAFVTQELGFDACLDHRAAEDARALRKGLAAACPKGVDIYYENTGGKALEAVIGLMNPFGRIPLCGTIAWYNSGGLGKGATDGPNLLPGVWRAILVNRLSVRGFIVTDHYDRFGDFLKEVAPMISDGRIRYRESIAEGLEAAPEAFIRMLEGGNFGKQLVAVSPDPTRGAG